KQPRSRIAALEQIMAENLIFWKTSLEGSFESVDVINPLADEGAFGKQVLVNIGHGAGVRIYAWLGAAEPGIARLVGSGKAHRHARLQNAITLGYALPVLVIAGDIQRMRHCSHQLPRRAA